MTEEKLAFAEATIDELTGELARVRKEFEQFTYVVSHDVQAPVRHIVAFAEMLVNRCDGQLGEDGARYLKFITDSAATLQNLLSALLSYSRLNQTVLDRTETDLGLLVNTVLTRLHTQDGAELSRIVLGEMPVVSVHSSMIESVFEHLLSNAFKFSVGPEKIRVSARRSDGQWQFSVADKGIGINARHHEAIFTVFRRLHGVSDYPGLGMGLAICKLVVERHGGRIQVVSEPGKGAEFLFTIPDP